MTAILQETPARLTPQWNNSNNAALYEALPIDDLYLQAVQGGLDSGCDVEAMHSYISRTSSILEIGAGYGRVLTHIINTGYQGELFAVERSSKYTKFLRSQFGKRASIIEADIRSIEFIWQVDLIIWMYTGIAEFTKVEQAAVLAKLFSFLRSDGILIFDTIPLEIKCLNATQSDSQNRTISNNHGTLHGYFPSNEEIENYAKIIRANGVKYLNYITATNRQRTLNILQKK